MQNQIKQVWHDAREWEELAHNMWGKSECAQADLSKAIAFTSDHALYGYFMRKVCNEWSISCENALTDPHLNQKAWLGHAAVALALRIPEDITRKAWGFLTDEQKFLANKEAEREIAIWKERYIKDKCLCSGLGVSLL